jgi:hypothetical protein
MTTKQSKEKAISKKKPRKEDVPGYVKGVYDVPGHFQAMALFWKIWPFYRGSDHKPFECLAAEVVNAPIYGNNGKVVANSYHSYYPREECRHLYSILKTAP